jgi:hypothetical protein
MDKVQKPSNSETISLLKKTLLQLWNSALILLTSTQIQHTNYKTTYLLNRIKPEECGY